LPQRPILAQDMPWPLFYKELYELYPDAKFILTYRNPDSWIKSVIKYFASIRIPLHKEIYKVPCAEGYEEVYLNFYKNLNNQIIEFFSDKDNFIQLETGTDFNYNKIYSFLEIDEIPQKVFPNSRKNIQYLSKYKIYRDIRSYYINHKKGY